MTSENTRFWMLFPVCEHACADIGGSCPGDCNLMSVDQCCGIGICMAHLCSGRYQVYTVGDHGRGCRMPEGMGMDVRKIMFPAEVPQPIRDAVRVHGGTIIPNKHIGGIRPAVAVILFQLIIGLFPLLQNSI